MGKRLRRLDLQHLTDQLLISFQAAAGDLVGASWERMT